MHPKPDDHSDEVEALTRRGLDYYGRNFVAEAIGCWREVLRLDPDNKNAREYLELASAAGGASSVEQLAPPSHRELHPATVQNMIAAGRFDDALAWLYETRDRHPDASAVSEQIRAVRDLISESATQRLGRTDVAPVRRRRDAPAGNHDVAYLLDRIDGVCTIDDLVTISRLPRHKTLRALVSLLDEGFIGFDSPSPGPAHSEPGPRKERGLLAEPRPSETGFTPSPARAQDVLGGPQRAVELRLVSSDDTPRPPAESAPPGEPRALSGRRPRVLIAESDSTRATMLRVLLGSAYDFLFAHSGPEALETAVRQAPDAIVIAFQLGGLDGVETARRIRGLPSLRRVGIVLTATGLEANIVRRSLRELGARLVEKPIQREELQTTLTALLQAGDD